MSLLFKRVSSLKVHFLCSPFPYSKASNLGKIYASFSGEIVTSSSVLDHRVMGGVLGLDNIDKSGKFSYYVLLILAISSQMIMRFGRNIQWVEIFSNLKNPGEVISNSKVLRHNSHFDVSRLLKS